ncbi:NUDIX domain-containing protein [Brevundimonas sp.]|uniref:NUDIX domain-containing protein n=1 Tax=Brevundimonas sp. TaxID=1871086 RepID=UPI002FC7ED69
MTQWRTRIEPFTRPLFFIWSRLSRGMTLGVRVIATDERGRILLVKHTYLHGWWLPGGGVDKGETTHAAAIREVREEAGLIAISEPRLVSIHSNERFFPGDHVVVFHIDRFEMTERTSHGEIAEISWFAPDALPDDITPASRHRILEYLGQKVATPEW